MLCALSKNIENNRQKVLVSTSADVPPALFMEGGVAKGYVIEMLGALSDITGLEFEFTEMKVSSALTSLTHGSVDVVPCLIVTDDRKKTIDFSSSYDTGFLVIVHPKNSIFPTLDSLRDKKVAVSIGTAMERLVNKQNVEMSLDLDIHRYDDLNSAIQSLSSGKVDATIVSYDNSVAIKDDNLSSSILGVEFKCAFGFRKNREDDLLERINLGLNFLKRSGRINKIRSKWSYYSS